MLNKAITVRKATILPILAIITSSLTFKYGESIGISNEIWTGAIFSLLIAIKDVLKHSLGLRI